MIFLIKCCNYLHDSMKVLTVAILKMIPVTPVWGPKAAIWPKTVIAINKWINVPKLLCTCTYTTGLEGKLKKDSKKPILTVNIHYLKESQEFLFQVLCRIRYPGPWLFYRQNFKFFKYLWEGMRTAVNLYMRIPVARLETRARICKPFKEASYRFPCGIRFFVINSWAP